MAWIDDQGNQTTPYIQLLFTPYEAEFLYRVFLKDSSCLFWVTCDAVFLSFSSTWVTHAEYIVFRGFLYYLKWH